MEGDYLKYKKGKLRSNKTQLIKVQTMRVTRICQDESCGVSGVWGYALLRGITGHVFIFNLQSQHLRAQHTQIYDEYVLLSRYDEGICQEARV